MNFFFFFHSKLSHPIVSQLSFALSYHYIWRDTWKHTLVNRLCRSTDEKYFSSHPHFFIPSQHGWKNEKKKKLFALSREKTLHESVISSRIKTKKKLEGLEEGSRFPPLVVSKHSQACKITRTRISSLEASTGFFLHNVYLLLWMAR